MLRRLSDGYNGGQKTAARGPNMWLEERRQLRGVEASNLKLAFLRSAAMGRSSPAIGGVIFLTQRGPQMALLLPRPPQSFSSSCPTALSTSRRLRAGSRQTPAAAIQTQAFGMHDG